MHRHGYATEEVVRRGREIRESELRAEVANEHYGEFVVVDVTTGTWEIGKGDVAV